jgi:hypothetical protein
MKFGAAPDKDSEKKKKKKKDEIFFEISRRAHGPSSSKRISFRLLRFSASSPFEMAISSFERDADAPQPIA